MFTAKLLHMGFNRHSVLLWDCSNKVIAAQNCHIVTENQRVLDTVAALERGDMQTVGALMAAPASPVLAAGIAGFSV